MGAETTLRMILLGEDRSAGRALKGVGDDADKTSGKMQKFHKVGHAAGLALAGGLTLVAAASVKATQAAASDDLARTKMAQTFRKAAGASDAQIASTEDWITAQGKATGVTDDELRPALARLVSSTHDVGKSQKLAHLAMDISAAKGKSLSSVTEALAKAQNGNTAGLSKMGVAVKDASGKTKSLHDITKELSDTYGGAAAASADTAAGKQKILTTQMGELQEQIGYKLLPVMSKLVEAGLKIVDWISRNATLVGVFVGVLGGLALGVWAVSSAIKAWAAITRVITGLQIAWNAAMAMNPIGLIVLAVIALIAICVLAYRKVGWFRDGVNAAFHGVQAVVGAVVGWIRDHWQLMLILLTGGVGVAVVLIVRNFGKVMDVIHLLGKVGIWLWNNVFQPVFRFIVDGIGTLLGFWARMLGVMGHVPGFGWAKDAANAMGDAADQAHRMADGINKIPTHKSSTVVLNVVHNVVHTTGGRVPVGQNARGTSSWRGGLTWLGEAGPELVDLPHGSRVHSALASRRIAGGAEMGGNLGTVTVVLQDRNGREIQRELLKLKRENGGLSLGLT